MAYTLVCLGMLSACGDSFTIEEVAGTYQLSAIEGQSLPYLEVATSECDQFITGGELDLSADETYSLTLDVELDCGGTGGPDRSERAYSGDLSLADDRLELRWEPPVGETEVFEGRVRDATVDVTLPSQIVDLDGFLDLRFRD